MKTILPFILLVFCSISYSQTTISGSVVDDSGQPIPGANIIVVGTSTGNITDFDGNFSLTYSQNPPFSVQASSIGFESITIQVTKNKQVLCFILNEGSVLDSSFYFDTIINYRQNIIQNDKVGFIDNQKSIIFVKLLNTNEA